MSIDEHTAERQGPSDSTEWMTRTNTVRPVGITGCGRQAEHGE